MLGDKKISPIDAFRFNAIKHANSNESYHGWKQSRGTKFHESSDRLIKRESVVTSRWWRLLEHVAPLSPLSFPFIAWIYAISIKIIDYAEIR